MHRRSILDLTLCLIGGLIACGAAPPNVTLTTSTPVPPALAKLTTQRVQWRALNIADYQVIVREEYAFSVTTRYTGTVRGGQVQSQESSCLTPQQPSNQCQIGVGNANQYTVPGLFDRAEQFINGTWNRQMGLGTKSSPRPNGSTVFYDPAYGFPSANTWDLPDVYDQQVTISVVSFARFDPATPAPATPSPATPSR